MWTKNSLTLTGFKGRSIYNRFYTHDTKADSLTVIFAGFAYTIEAPLLFYSKYAAYRHNSDVLVIDFEYSRHEKFLALDDGEKDEWFSFETQRIAEILTISNYKTFGFLGKSLGTGAIFQILQNRAVLERTEKVVWLTPGTDNIPIRRFMGTAPFASLLVYGTADPYAAEPHLPGLKERPNVALLEIPDGDHILEGEDVLENLDILKMVVAKIDEFLS